MISSIFSQEVWKYVWMIIQKDMVRSWGFDFIFLDVWVARRREMTRREDGNISVEIETMKRIINYCNGFEILM